MVLNGRDLLSPNHYSTEARRIAAEAFARGPISWSRAEIDKERFLITDILDDIKHPKSKEEQIASAIHLFEPMIQFYFRSQGQWAASGKSLMRLLQKHNPILAQELNQGFEDLVKSGDATGLESGAEKILSPHGGSFWDGFRADAPQECRPEPEVLAQLKSREPIFHHPEKYGKSKEDIEKQMCEEFWEVGASGNVYTRQDVVETLLERYNDPEYSDVWEVSDFMLTQISVNNYLLTYILVQDKTRLTRRATIWRKDGPDWKILYHQGTLMPSV